MQDIGLEYLEKYKLEIIQPVKGYRYSIDSFLLADFVSREKFTSAIELGGGCGIVSFLLKRLHKNLLKVEIFEKQDRLFKCLKQNCSKNYFGNLKFNLRNEDVKYAIQSFIPDIIYLNPPFYKQSDGKVSPFEEKAIARHEFYLDLEEIFSIFLEMGGENTKFAMIHVFDRKKEIEELAHKFQLNIDKIQLIKPCNNQSPKHVIFLFSHNYLKTKVSEIYVYDKFGNYTSKMEKLLVQRKNHNQ